LAVLETEADEPGRAGCVIRDPSKMVPLSFQARRWMPYLSSLSMVKEHREGCKASTETSCC